MKIRLIIFILISSILWNCTTSKQVVELQQKIDHLEFQYLKELTENVEITNTTVVPNIVCIKTSIWISQENRYKNYDKTITFDSLKVKYNGLLDRYDDLKISYFTAKQITDSITSINSEAIMKKIEEYKNLRKQTKKSSK
jgi:hypothetical protein